MNCESFEALLTKELEGTLTKEEAAQMKEHAQSCASCAQAELDLQALLQDLESMDDSAQVPAEWSQRWRQAIRDEERTQMIKQEETQRGKGRSLRTILSAAAAVVVLITGSLAARDLIPSSTAPKTQQERSSGNVMAKSAPGANYSYAAPQESTADYAAAPSPDAGSGSLTYSAKDESSQYESAQADTSTGETLNGLKIIRTASYSLATMSFEKDLQAIKDLAASYQGWVEYAGISGDTSQGDMRYASLTLRIPSASLTAFETGVAGIGRVTGSSENAQDVSEDYADTTLRLNTQKTKMERLQALLKNSGELADLLAVENEIANTQYQIDSYESTLKGLDSRINYSSVQISLQEETAGDVVNVQTLTLGERILKGLEASLAGIWQFLQDMAVFLVMALPVILPLALIVLIVILKRKHRKHA